MNKIKNYILKNPYLAILLAFLIISKLLRSGIDGLIDSLLNMLLLLPGMVIGITFHEAAHAYSSYKLGDQLPMRMGRVTLNPAAHIDVWGFIWLIIAGFGWGQPVQIDPRYYKHRRRDELIVSLAGVVTNLVIAIVFALVYRALRLVLPAVVLTSIVGQVLMQIVLGIVSINVVLCFFNLIPCPPLDGWGVITQIFNLQKYEWWYKVYQRGFLILMILIIFNVTDVLVSVPASAVLKLLLA